MPQATKSPYDVFQQAIAAGVRPTIQECWADFARWEVARHFADDPSHPAKAAIEWIYAIEDLRGGLDEFTGQTMSECWAALDQAYEAFAKLEHSEELVHAIETWLQFRLEQS